MKNIFLKGQFIQRLCVMILEKQRSLEKHRETTSALQQLQN